MAVQESGGTVIRQAEEERERSVECIRGEILLIFDVHINKKVFCDINYLVQLLRVFSISYYVQQPQMGPG